MPGKTAGGRSIAAFFERYLGLGLVKDVAYPKRPA